MVQTHEQDIADNQQEAASTQDPNIRALAQNEIATDNLHLTGAQALQDAGNSIIAGIDTSGITNVRESFRHPGNGTLAYNLTFSAGGFTYASRYTLRITGHAQPSAGTALTGRDAVEVFLQSLLNRINDETGTGGTSTDIGASSTGTGATGQPGGSTIPSAASVHGFCIRT
jgi:hypothetical protein